MAMAPPSTDQKERTSEGAPEQPEGGDDQVAAQPFIRGSLEVEKPAGVDENVSGFSTSRQSLGPFKVPPSGFLRHVLLDVEASGGSGATTAAVGDEDAPWSALAEVAFRDIGGDALVNPIGGYDLYLVNKYGAYSWMVDPRSSPRFSDLDAGGNFTFLLRVPLEVIARNAWGALSNRDARSAYQLELALSPESDVYSTSPDTPPTDVDVKAWLESRSRPPAVDPILGVPNQQDPPDLGTTQFWVKETHNIVSGNQDIHLKRKGAWIRTIVLIFRDSAGARDSTNFPDTVRFRLDDGDIYRQRDKRVWRHKMAEAYGLDGADDAAAGLDTGVFVFTFADDLDGHPGSEQRLDYLLTDKSSDIVIEGDFGVDGTLTILTNDIIPA